MKKKHDSMLLYLRMHGFHKSDLKKKMNEKVFWAEWKRISLHNVYVYLFARVEQFMPKRHLFKLSFWVNKKKH